MLFLRKPFSRLRNKHEANKQALAPGDKAKCNYCESRIEKPVKLQVEHYRPKALISPGINDQVELPGYYWLGLEWTNLLLACPKCNGKDAKANKFPIRGVRAVAVNPITPLPGYGLSLDRIYLRIDSNTLTNELPILLNPKVDHPEDYLTFNIDGVMDGYGQNKERGDSSWQTYRLNRHELVVERLDILEKFKEKIMVDTGAFELNVTDEVALIYYFTRMCKDMLRRTSAEEEYTFWGRYVNDHINDFNQKYVPQVYGIRFRNAYNAAVAEQQAALNLAVNN